MYPPQYPPYPYMMPVRPQRSGAPRVIGVLAIVFCGLGLLGSAVWTFGPLSDLDDVHNADLDPVKAWLWAWMAMSVGVAIIELIAGIQAVQYKRSGLRLMTVYAIVAIVLAVADVVLMLVLIPDRYRHHGGTGDVWFSAGVMHIFFSVMALPWPIVALAIANGARAKEACGTPTMQAADVF